MKKVLLIILTVTLASCDTGFGTTCGEDNEAVKLARSLTQERMTTLYKDIYELRTNSTRRDIYYANQIPVNFADLNATRIDPSFPRGPTIVLADCLDEHIFLDFYGESDEKPRIELVWYTGPYTVKKQILWEKRG